MNVEKDEKMFRLKIPSSNDAMHEHKTFWLHHKIIKRIVYILKVANTSYLMCRHRSNIFNILLMHGHSSNISYKVRLNYCKVANVEW